LNFRDRRISPIVVLVLVLVTLGTPEATASPSVSTQANVRAAYAKLPLAFERNEGQVSSEVEYLSRGRDATLFLTGTEAVLQLRRGAAAGAVLRMRLANANRNPKVSGEQLLQGKLNYLIGNDRKKWRTAVPTYRQVRYDEVWPGIDLVWHGTRSALEYDFIVQPGSDPARVRIAFEGSKRIRVDREGNLIAKTAAGDVVQNAPVIYQDGPQGRTTINGRYAIKGRREVAFEIGAYDRSKPLIIDPVLNYSTYLGGTKGDEAFAVAVDSEGHAYVTGTTNTNTFAGDFPVKGFEKSSSVSVFVTKLNADGSDLIYSALIGASADDIVDQVDDVGGTISEMISNGIAVTADGKACITGGIFNPKNDSKLPVTDNAFQGNGPIPCLGAVCGVSDPPSRRTDVFVTMLNAQGDDLVYSTFYGDSAYLVPWQGNEVGQAIAVDASQRIYITGRTDSEGLAMRNEFQHHVQSDDAFIAVFDPFLKRGNDTLLYASYLGGKENDIGLGIAVDADRNAYVVGSTASEDLETTSPTGQPLQATFQGGSFDGFVAKVDTKLRGKPSLIYLTYFGGNVNDRVEGVAVDAARRAYITGASNSSPTTFPLLNAFDATQFNGEAFVAKLNTNGDSLFYCSFLGGENGNGAEDGEEGMGIAIDAGGNAYVTGRTTSGASFPAGPFAPPFPEEQQGTAFLAKIEAANFSNRPAKLLYATTFGGKGAKAEGIAVDPKGNVYLAGTTSGELPTTNGAFQTTFGGETDAFIAKVNSTLNDTTGIYSLATHEFFLRNSNTSGAADLTVNFGDDAEDLPVAGDWDADGETDLGVFRPSTGQFLLRQRQLLSFVTTTVQFSSESGGELPVIGDFDGDGFDTVGLFAIGEGDPFFVLSNFPVPSSVVPKTEIQFFFGKEGDLPIAGDWDGDGLDTVGVYRPSTSEFFLVNDFSENPVVTTFVFGVPGDLPLAGDWNGDGVDGVGVYSKAASTMHLSDDFGVTESVFRFAEFADLPVAGNWDGK
jgi:hypothetical protein